MRAKFWVFSVLVVSMAFFAGCDGDGDGTTAADGAAEAIDVTGTWSGDITLPSGPTGVTLVMTQTGSAVTAEGGYTGTLTGSRLILTRNPAITIDVTVVGNTMTGTYSDSSWNDRPITMTKQ